MAGEIMASPKSNKNTAKKSNLPPVAAARLKPFIDRGIANGIFTDDSAVVNMFKAKAQDPTLKETLSSLGGLKSEVGQAFLTDIVLTDLTAILRQKRYTAHMKVWEVSHNTVGAASGTPRAVCNIFGQVVVETDDEVLDPALFSMSLWDADASIGDDVERDGVYIASVSCKALNSATLDLKALAGLTQFVEEEYEHSDSVEMLKDTYEVTPIAELADDVSRGRADYRLVEATVSFSGVQNSKSGNQFGKMLLKDESTMTLEAIESGENLLLNALCSTDIATRYGKYSRVLALCTTKVQGEWGLSASIAVALGVIVVAPPVAETSSVAAKEDDASSYFKKAISLDDDDDDDDEEETVEEVVVEEVVVEEPAPTKPSKASKASKGDDDTSEEEAAPEATSKEAESASPKEGEEGWVEGDDDSDDEWGDWE
tara:strand:- start:2784 stop:4067 length:1284 start_codon:yes stop_codon:yes gene_type:complete